MKNILTVLFLMFFLGLPVMADAHLYNEKYYQNEWCSRWHGAQEVTLKDKTRVDCVTKNYAVEFDFAQKWAESIGQAMYYAKMTGKNPAIILIIEKPSDFKHYKKAEKITEDLGIKLWYMKSPKYQYLNFEYGVKIVGNLKNLFFNRKELN